MSRSAQVHRSTRETDVTVELDLDGGRADISTGVGFFDHMLTCHHTVEDVGIVLGQALGKALGDKAGLARYGHAFVPMDEALAFCAVDVSGRPFLVFEGEFPQERIGEYDSCMTEEFFRAVAMNSGITLHLRCEYGKNAHHMVEAMFKAFAHGLREAVARAEGVLSTKGSL